ncbi:hypothetical protein JL720_6856 [Aureococcus anophagefferens]|nr:hypothetical protein JL720_6856 [Aureococcus anophagefferens]
MLAEAVERGEYPFKVQLLFTENEAASKLLEEMFTTTPAKAPKKGGATPAKTPDAQKTVEALDHQEALNVSIALARRPRRETLAVGRRRRGGALRSLVAVGVDGDRVTADGVRALVVALPSEDAWSASTTPGRAAATLDLLAVVLEGDASERGADGALDAAAIDAALRAIVPAKAAVARLRDEQGLLRDYVDEKDLPIPVILEAVAAFATKLVKARERAVDART